MRYVNLLLDADDTLFDFPKASARAFSRMCQLHDIPDTPDVYQLYHQINLELWNAFDRGEVTKEFVTLERYVRFFDALHLKRDAAACNRDYLAALGECVYPLPHAEDVCRTLVSRGHRLYIITNAVASVQRARLSQSAITPYIQGAFISEEAGAAKPARAYYDHVLARIPGASAENTLAIGDSLTTDIAGANNAGLPCCWYNPRRDPRPQGLHIDYEIQDLRALLDLV